MKKLTWLFVFTVIVALGFDTAFASEACPDCGSVSGTISVWKTKVITEGSKSGKDVVVYLEDKNGKVYPPPETIPEMDQQGLVFIPHVMAVQKGMTVRFLNNDSVDHNVYFLFEKTGETLDIGTYPQGVHVDYKFEDTGSVIVLCKLHLEMAAYILVLDNPYYTLSDIDADSQTAQYSIENVPPGDYILKAWHKKLQMKGELAEISIESGKVTNFDITITKKKYAK